VLKYLGREGLKKIVGECMRLTGILVARAKEMGILPVIEPVMNVVTLDLPEAEVERVANALVKRKWRVSLTRKPKALRLVIMPHIDEETIHLFAEDLKDVR
jgi:tyrosine decarboxylase/aspartate 1-decarboxylase